MNEMEEFIKLMNAVDLNKVPFSDQLRLMTALNNMVETCKPILLRNLILQNGATPE